MPPLPRVQSAVEIRRGTVADLREHAPALLQEHYDEVALDKTVPMCPDWERFDVFEQKGILLILCAWDREGRLVGYSVNVMGRHLHYELFWCQNDVLFLTQSLRKTGTGLRLMRETEKAAREEGCERMAWHCKQGQSMHHLLDRLPGYRINDLIYTRSL